MLQAASSGGVPAQLIGATGGSVLEAPGLEPTLIAALKAVHETWLPEYMNGA
jgi:phosphoribosylformylglycinamidine synthase